MIAGGMNWKQALFTVFLGNLLVLIPMLLNAHAGAQYGIPFPVFARASFGVLGANVPAVLRALVACGWFGIQTWIGGEAINAMIVALAPSLGTFRRRPGGLLHFFLAAECRGDPARHRDDSVLAGRLRASLVGDGACSVALGRLQGRRLRSDACDAFEIRHLR